ncbi:MAG: Gar1/Naf1 family protein [Candidatus Bathyarchaeota archaeon]|jgi:rRNA processing protein Gar1
MRRLGSVLHISSSSRNLILKAEPGAKIGEAVLDSRGKKIGTVFDIFGPVVKPYASVKPKIKDPKRLIGEDLYFKKGKKQ